MAALQYVDVPGYAALLLRRTYKDLALEGALMDRAFQWLAPTDAHWDGQHYRWRFPGGGTLTFGYLATENDKYRYQSAEFTFVGFDELTQFESTQYRYLFSRLRRLQGANVPLRMRSASNPGGVGHDWVRQRFIVEGRAKGRVFIPAKLEDNPHLDQAEYDAALANLDPLTRAQLRDGDWSAKPVGKYKREWFKVVDADAVPWQELIARGRYWDLAATEPAPGKDPDWTAGCKGAISQAGDLYLIDLARDRRTPKGVEDLVRWHAQNDGADYFIWIEQEGGASGKSLIDYYGRNVLNGRAFWPSRPEGEKSVRAAPLAAMAEGGRVFVVRGVWNGEFFDEWEAFCGGGAHDDQVDAASGLLRELTSGHAYVVADVLEG